MKNHVWTFRRNFLFLLLLVFFSGQCFSASADVATVADTPVPAPKKLSWLDQLKADAKAKATGALSQAKDKAAGVFSSVKEKATGLAEQQISKVTGSKQAAPDKAAVLVQQNSQPTVVNVDEKPVIENVVPASAPKKLGFMEQLRENAKKTAVGTLGQATAVAKAQVTARAPGILAQVKSVAQDKAASALSSAQSKVADVVAQKQIGKITGSSSKTEPDKGASVHHDAEEKKPEHVETPETHADVKSAAPAATGSMWARLRAAQAKKAGATPSLAKVASTVHGTASAMTPAVHVAAPVAHPAEEASVKPATTTIATQQKSTPPAPSRWASLLKTKSAVTVKPTVPTKPVVPAKPHEVAVKQPEKSDAPHEVKNVVEKPAAVHDHLPVPEKKDVSVVEKIDKAKEDAAGDGDHSHEKKKPVKHKDGHDKHAVHHGKKHKQKAAHGKGRHSWRSRPRRKGGRRVRRGTHHPSYSAGHHYDAKKAHEAQKHRRLEAQKNRLQEQLAAVQALLKSGHGVSSSTIGGSGKLHVPHKRTTHSSAAEHAAKTLHERANAIRAHAKKKHSTHVESGSSTATVHDVPGHVAGKSVDGKSAAHRPVKPVSHAKKEAVKSLAHQPVKVSLPKPGIVKSPVHLPVKPLHLPVKPHSSVAAPAG